MLRRLHLRFVLPTGASAAGVTLDHLAVEGTKRVLPGPMGPSGPVDALSVFRGHCRGQNSRRQNSLRRNGPLRGDHPANV